MATVRTVLGDLPAADLGPTDYHEHLFQASPLRATKRLLLGGDVARRTRFVAYGGLPGMGYLGTRVIPRLIRTGHSQLVEAALVANPARLLARFPAPDAAAKETHD
jgi:predicted metal-dependent phosphotriesterase family hydrolase